MIALGGEKRLLKIQFKTVDFLCFDTRLEQKAMRFYIEFFFRKIILRIIQPWPIKRFEFLRIRCNSDGLIEQFPAEEINSVL
jgi:hypothetical protein